MILLLTQSGSQEGLFTIVFAAVSFFLLPRTPSDTYVLTEEEKRYVETALRADGIIAKNEQDDAFSWFQVGAAFRQIHVLIMTVAGFVSGKSGLAFVCFYC